jgi:hypothetical protein
MNDDVKLAWAETYHHEIERRELIRMLALAKECYLIKMDLLTNARVLDEAMKFVARNQNNQNHISSEKVPKSGAFADGNGNGKESSSTEEEEDVVEEHEDLDDVEVATTDDRVF